MAIAAFATLVGLLSTGQTARDNPTAKVQTKPNMSTQKMELPFGLTETDLPSVEIMYGFYSAKTGAGKQEITISGSGKVKLFLTKTRTDAPTVREEKIDLLIVVRLLDLMAEQ